MKGIDMNLNPVHKKLLHSPSLEDKTLAEKALPYLRDAQKNVIQGAILACLISLIFSIASNDGYSYWPTWVITAVFWVLTISFIRDYYYAEGLQRAIQNGDFEVLHGNCRKSIINSLPVAERFEVHGIIPGTDVPFVFDVDFSVIKAMPESTWEFIILANDRRAIVLIPGPEDDIFLSTNITKYYPYCEED